MHVFSRDFCLFNRGLFGVLNFVANTLVPWTVTCFRPVQMLSKELFVFLLTLCFYCRMATKFKAEKARLAKLRSENDKLNAELGTLESQNKARTTPNIKPNSSPPEQNNSVNRSPNTRDGAL